MFSPLSNLPLSQLPCVAVMWRTTGSSLWMITPWTMHLDLHGQCSYILIWEDNTSGLKTLLYKKWAGVLRDRHRRGIRSAQRAVCEKTNEEKGRLTKLETSFLEKNARQYWQDLGTTVGYRHRKIPFKSTSKHQLADKLNVLSARFDQHDFQKKRDQVMTEMFSHLPS